MFDSPDDHCANDSFPPPSNKDILTLFKSIKLFPFVGRLLNGVPLESHSKRWTTPRPELNKKYSKFLRNGRNVEKGESRVENKTWFFYVSLTHHHIVHVRVKIDD